MPPFYIPAWCAIFYVYSHGILGRDFVLHIYSYTGVRYLIFLAEHVWLKPMHYWCDLVNFKVGAVSIPELWSTNTGPCIWYDEDSLQKTRLASSSNMYCFWKLPPCCHWKMEVTFTACRSNLRSIIMLSFHCAHAQYWRILKDLRV